MASVMSVIESESSNSTVNTSPENQLIYCPCQSEYCDCGSNLGVTEAAARKVYQHLGFPQGRETLKAEGHRECALHVWGTHNLSTEDILSWLADYHPANIEWINDASCNVIFADPNTVLRVIVDCAEPFDRRVALAAAAALATLLDEKDEEDQHTHSVKDDLESASSKVSGPASLHLSSDALDSIEHFSQYLPPTGRWYKALSVPPKTVSLFLRFAHKSDVKLPGSERRSLYYRRYGNPNYGGVPGILSRSYRRRLRLVRSKSDADSEDGTHNVRAFPRGLAEAVAKAYEDPDAVASPTKTSGWAMKPNFASNETKPIDPPPERELIVYDNLYGPDEQRQLKSLPSSARIGSRREAVGFPIPKSPKQPRKWPRKDSGPPPNRWLIDDDEEDAFSPPPLDNINVIDLREPWSTLPESEPFVFSGAVDNRRVYQRSADGTTTITLLPDPQSPERPNRLPMEDLAECRTRRLLASMTMVADIEEHSVKKRSLASRLGSHRAVGADGVDPPTGRQRSRNVWQRLG